MEAMAMKWKMLAAAFLVVPLCCARDFPDWYYHQDRTIKMPRFNRTEIDGVVDGPTAQALHVVEDDFLPAPSKRYPCYYTPKALVYKVIRRGDIIFVEVEIHPEACGDQSALFDGSGRYAVSLDGRILRRQLDLEPGEEEPYDGGPWPYPPVTDGGLCPTGDYLPRAWMEELRREGVCPEEPDGGASVEGDGGTSLPDGGVSMPEDAGLPAGWGGRSGKRGG
jgi:hypothetical protein